MYINFKTEYQILIQHKCSKHAVWKGWIVFNARGKKDYSSSCAAKFGKQETSDMLCSVLCTCIKNITLLSTRQAYSSPWHRPTGFDMPRASMVHTEVKTIWTSCPTPAMASSLLAKSKHPDMAGAS